LQFSLADVKTATGDNSLSSGPVDEDNVVISGTGVAGDDDDYFIYDTDDGKLYFDQDGSGGESAVQLATLVGYPTLAVDDLALA
jgi:hypothetical protein